MASINPTSGPIAGGTSVTVTGTNFVAGATVSFGSNAGTSVVVTSPTSLTVNSPAGSAGLVNVTVHNPDGTSTQTVDFTYFGTATQLVITTEPSSTASSGAALGTQPVVKVEDSGGRVVTSVNSGTASATIHSGGGGSIAAGGTSGTFSSGVATFSGLALNGVNGTAYTLTFSGDGFTSAASSTITMSTGAATQLAITTEPSTTDASGAALATQPVVKVEDSGGNVVTTDSSTVTASFTSGGVSLTNPTKAAASGVATFSGLALNALASNYTLTFSDGGLTTAVSNTITVSTGAATQLVITTEPSATANSGAALATQPVVKVEDSGGNVVSVNSGTASATIVSGAGGSIAAGGTSGTFSNGVATFSSLALNGVNGTAYTLTFSGDSLTSAATTSITVSTGAATKLVITTEPSTTDASGAALATQPVVKVEDSGGNVVTSVNTGTASATIVSGGGGSIAAGGTSGTFSSGVATFSALALNGVNGTAYTLTFTGDSLTSAASTSITMSTGAATQLVITTEPSATANSGAALGTQPVVKVEDSGGNVVSVNSGTASATISGAGGSIAAGGTSGTFSSGVATFSALALNGVNGTAYTLTFSGDSLTSAASTSITMSTGAATKLVITTQPSTTDASGAALATQPVVKVEDSGGNVVTTNTSTVTASFTSGGVSLTNPTKAAASGVATFSGLALNALASNYTLTFSDGGLTTAVSNTITVSTGAATQLVITTEPSATANSGAALATQPVVKVEDSGGNVVSVNSGTASATIVSGGGGSIAAGGTSGTFSSGVATFSGLALNGVNGTAYTLTFSGDGFTSAASSTITMSTGAATKLVIATEPSTTDASGAALATQPVVKVEDSGGNVVTTDSSTVTASFTSGGVSLTNPTTAAASGVATFSGLALNALASNYTLTFSDGGLTTAVSNTITVSTGAATQLVITTEPSATANSGAALATQPVVKVEDSGGNVVTTNTSTVTASFTSGGVSLTNPTKAAASGVATFSGLALNALASNYTLTFSDGGLTTAVSNTITVSTGAATQLVITTEPSATANSGAALATQPVVKVEDSGGNVVSVSSGTASATIVSGAGGSIAAGGTSGTFSNGVATFSGLALNGVNGTAYTLTFSGDSFTSAATTSITVSTGAATKLVITTEPSTTDASGAALATQPVVKVEDSGGNVVTTDSSTVTASFTSGGVSLTNPTTAAASGVATFSGLALNALASNYTLTFSDGGLTTAVSSTITVSTGAATQLVITTEPSATDASGAALATQPVVKVEDSGGNVVSVSSGTASATISGAGGSIAAGGTSGTFSSGVATFSGLALNGVNGTAYTLTFSGDGFTSAVSSNITMATGGATQLVFTTSPGNSTNGLAFSAQPVVKVEDSGGNVVSGSSASIMLTPSSGALTCTTNPLSASSGVATFAGCSLAATAGSGYSLSATSSGLASATSSPTFSLATGAASQLVFTSAPSSQGAAPVAGTSAFVVQAEDSGGNPVVNTGSSATVTPATTSTGTTFFTTSSGGSTGSGTVSIPNGSSSSNSFYYADDKAGTWSISATATVDGNGVSTSPNAMVLIAAASPTLTVSGPASGNAGTAIAGSAVSSTMVGSSGPNATATITFTVFGPGAEPTSCTSGGTTLGTATPAGDGTYTSSGTFTPTVAGDYWWYASSAGDANNNAAASACATGMSETIVGLASPTLTASGPATGNAGTAIAGSAVSSTMVGSSGPNATATITFTVFGPGAEPTSCTSGGTTLGTATPAGDGTYTSSGTFTPTVAGDYWWYASSAGDANNNAAASACATGMSETIVGLASPTLTVSGPASGNAGTAIAGSAVSSTMVGSSGPNATATITFTVFGPGAEPTSCTSGGTTLGTATPAGDGTYTSSGTFTPTVAGDYWWYASSAGDANNNAAASACATGMSETIVGLASPTLTASGPATGNAGTAIAGSAVSSTMVGSSGPNATATITFTVFGPGAEPTSCTSGGTTLGTATPAGDGTYTSSGTFTPTVAGDYWWYASSAGDANNNAAASACATGMSETIVGLASPTLTVSGPASGNAGTAIAGSAVSSTMVGSSGPNATATITFTVFGPGAEPTSCTSGGTTLGTATPAGDGTYTSSGTFTPTVAGDYWWYASSAGDANNNAAASACATGMSETIVGLASPTLTVSGPATGNAGTAIAGSAVSSTMVGSSGPNATATITFTVFGPGAEPTSCTSGGTTLGTATPAGDGTYTSSGTFTPTVAGDYWWYASSAGDANNNAAASACATGMSETIVGLAISATVVTSSANPAIYGATVTLTATVTGAATYGAPTGTVAFTDGSYTPLTCSVGSDSTLTPISSSASSATCLYTPPAVGNVGGTFNTIGTYSGDSSYVTSAGPLAQEVLGTLATVGANVFSANPSPNGAPVTMNDTLTDPSSTANPATAAGAFPATVTMINQGTGAVLCANVALSPTGTYTASWSCTFTPTGPGQTMLVRAVYSGNDIFAPSSGSATLVVAGTALTTPSVTASPTIVAVGASTTLQATLTGSPAPTGNVTFLDDGIPIPGCGRIVVQSGVAQSKCAYGPATAGSQTITVTYSGDTNYAAAGPSAPATVLVTGTTTSVTATPTLVSPSAPVPNGDPITVSTVVSGSGATPTGTVAFSATIGSSTSTPCATAPVNGSGSASCTFTPAFAAGTGGSVSITAAYSGDDTYGQSTSGPLSVTVLAIGLPSTFTLTTTQSPISVGSNAVLTAVIAGTPRPTGTVTFYDNGTPTRCGAVTITSTGKAVCTYAPAWGSHSLVATYSGNASYAPIGQSQSGFANTATLVVNATGPSTVAVISSANPSATGAPITFGATVTGGLSAVPTGTVTFSATIGSSTTTACAAVAVSPSTGTSVTASCMYTPPDSGNMITVTAAYSGDPTYAPQSGTFTETELGTAAPTGFTLTTTKGPLTVGTSATLTAALTGSPTPGGTVSFTDNGAPLSCGAVTVLKTGKATCTYTPTWGTHALVATYSGNATYAPISPSTGGFANSATLVVNSTGASTVAVTSSVNPSAYGAAVTLTATVTGSLSSAPTGTIAFSTSAGTLAAGCGAAALTTTGPTTSAATCVLTPPTSGTGVIITVDASYSGDPTYAPKAAADFSQTEAGAATPSMSLTSSANPAASGSQVTFTAALTGTVKPGTVTFTDNGTPVCTAVAIPSSGKATCADTLSGAGTHTIVASYTGNTTYAARQVMLNQTAT